MAFNGTGQDQIYQVEQEPGAHESWYFWQNALVVCVICVLMVPGVIDIILGWLGRRPLPHRNLTEEQRRTGDVELAVRSDAQRGSVSEWSTT